jgi:predicted O-linked N-acetylglucosamine transferase (SPINDLY family)
MVRNNPLTRAKRKQAWDYFRTNRLRQAKEVYRQICARDRLDDSAWAMLGIIHGQLNELDEAEVCLNKALTLNPGNFDAHHNLGLAFYVKGMPDQAIVSFRKALALKQDHINTLVSLGNAYARLDQLTQAQQCYERVLQLDPRHASAHGNLANVLAYQGNAELAIPLYRQAVAKNPNFAGMHSNLLLSLHYPASYDPSVVFQEHLAWAALHAQGTSHSPHPSIDRNPDRELRIGYVTPDLRGHSVAYFFEPLLTHHDRSHFAIFCYVERGLPDEMTRRLWKLADTIRNTSGQSDDMVAGMIRDDQIDILVDLAGHTENNRLPVFARKPAPIQITYLGYPDTTGMQAIDYRLTDEWADPPGMTEHLHTEELIRLKNGFLCFAPPDESPPIAPLPSIELGYVTFGSFNVLTKITPEMLGTWAKILLSIPNSRLLIKNRQLTDAALQERLYAQFEQHGVACERVDMLGRTSKEEHMGSYGKVDIALDTFPYHGTTTTCDTLWMGIPVITLAGKTHVSRVGVSLLTRVGLSELIANSEEEYIDHAVRLANSPQKLDHLRQNLRKMVEESGLVDGLSFTRNIESTYRQLWQTWCDTRH